MLITLVDENKEKASWNSDIQFVEASTTIHEPTETHCHFLLTSKQYRTNGQINSCKHYKMKKLLADRLKDCSFLYRKNFVSSNITSLNLTEDKKFV